MTICFTLDNFSLYSWDWATVVICRVFLRWIVCQNVQRFIASLRIALTKQTECGQNCWRLLEKDNEVQKWVITEKKREEFWIMSIKSKKTIWFRAWWWTQNTLTLLARKQNFAWSLTTKYIFELQYGSISNCFSYWICSNVYPICA